MPRATRTSSPRSNDADSGEASDRPVQFLFFSRLDRSGLLSHARSATRRSGFRHGRPGQRARRTGTLASVGSTSITSAGDTESRCAPSGAHAPSIRTIHIVPFLRFVLPTLGPFFTGAKLPSMKHSEVDRSMRLRIDPGVHPMEYLSTGPT
jgi:hypothetical protein